MDKDEANTIKEKVEYVLEHFPHTRDNDQKLTIQLWREFYGRHIHLGLIPVERIPLLPAENSVRRARAILQNEQGMYPPTDWPTAKKRGWQRRDWTRAYGKCNGKGWNAAWLKQKGLPK